MKIEIGSPNWLKLLGTPEKMENIIDIGEVSCQDGNKHIAAAGIEIRRYAQNIIDHIRDHRHLRGARILMLIQSKQSDRAKIEKCEQFVWGKAQKSSARDKLLTSLSGQYRADFVIMLSGDLLEAVKWQEEDRGLLKLLALIDHELMHCGVKIAGQFVRADEVDTFKEDKGDDLIEVCDDIIDDLGRKLVRYIWRNKDEDMVFKMRKHDIEEFTPVAARWGPWCRQLVRLIDVLEPEKAATLFKD